MMPVFSKQNPQLVIEERLHPGHHPWFKAEYSTRPEFSSEVEGLAAFEAMYSSVFSHARTCWLVLIPLKSSKRVLLACTSPCALAATQEAVTCARWA